jgi:hypothetical protein
MSMLGKLLALPIRLVNVPLTAAEKLMDSATGTKSERVVSLPLESLAQAVEDALKEE